MARKLSPLEECIKRAGSDMDKYTDCTAKYISIPRVAGEEEDEKRYKVKKTTKGGKSPVTTKTKKKSKSYKSYTEKQSYDNGDTTLKK